METWVVICRAGSGALSITEMANEEEAHEYVVLLTGEKYRLAAVAMKVEI